MNELILNLGLLFGFTQEKAMDNKRAISSEDTVVRITHYRNKPLAIAINKLQLQEIEKDSDLAANEKAKEYCSAVGGEVTFAMAYGEFYGRASDPKKLYILEKDKFKEVSVVEGMYLDVFDCAFSSLPNQCQVADLTDLALLERELKRCKK